MSNYAFNGAACVVVALGLPVPGILRRFAGGAAAVALSGNWGASATLLTATPAQAAANAVQFRTVIVGMLAAEVLQLSWSVVKHRG